MPKVFRFVKIVIADSQIKNVSSFTIRLSNVSEIVRFQETKYYEFAGLVDIVKDDQFFQIICFTYRKI